MPERCHPGVARTGARDHSASGEDSETVTRSKLRTPSLSVNATRSNTVFCASATLPLEHPTLPGR
jgi:hypothetical protein